MRPCCDAGALTLILVNSPFVLTRCRVCGCPNAQLGSPTTALANSLLALWLAVAALITLNGTCLQAPHVYLNRY